MKINKYLNISTSSVGMSKYRSDFNSQLSKFIHSSWVLKEDLDREVVLNGTAYTIWGLYDVHAGRYLILLKPVEGGPLFIEDSKVIARALGYTRMRNLITGEERKYEYFKRKGLVAVEVPVVEPETAERKADIDEDMLGEWVPQLEEDYVDPLVKALQDDITDDGDTSAY